jgi:hypothetical protein
MTSLDQSSQSMHLHINSSSNVSIGNALATSPNDSLKAQKKLSLLITPTCVQAEQELRDMIRGAKPFGKSISHISLCSQVIKISNIVDPISNSTGINVSNKRIYLECRVSGSCSLDGQNLNSILHGENAFIKTERANFISGGGNTGSEAFLSDAAISFFNSTVNISHSSIMNNVGGIVSALKAKGSKITLHNVAFRQNVAEVCW